MPGLSSGNITLSYFLHNDTSKNTCNSLFNVREINFGCYGPVSQTVSLCGATPATNQITGRVYLDANSDAIFDAGDISLSNKLVKLSPQNFYTATDSAGNYLLLSDTGAHSVSLQPWNYYTTDAPQQISFSTPNTTDTIDLRYIPTSPTNDLQIFVTKLALPIPGIGNAFQLTYRNVGNTILSGMVNFVPGDSLFFQASFPDTTQTSNDTLQWVFSNLFLGAEENIYAFFLPFTNTSLGTFIHNSAIVEPIVGDSTPNDNIAPLDFIVTGPYDPNNKTAEPEILSANAVAEKDYITYTIHFQNVGNAPAYFVRIEDTLSSLLDIFSFEEIASSHSNFYEINNHVVKFYFNNILLPDCGPWRMVTLKSSSC